MYVSELREILTKYSQEELIMLIAEMYKAMPKRLREDKDIDLMIQDIRAYMDIGKIKKKQDMQINISDLKLEIEQFIDYAYKQYYVAPNSFVHKRERPKWRFKVKAYIKDLQSIAPEGEEGKIATDLLKKLYEMLCYACGCYIFNTDDPFRSVGIIQTVLLDNIIARMLVKGINRGSVKSVIELVINSNVDRETLHSELIMELVKNLKTTDAKEIAIEECKALKQELNRPNPKAVKKSWTTEYSDYLQQEKINNLVETVFRLHVALCEFEEAIHYFNENYVERDKEISLYVLLKLLFDYELKDYWLREYERAVKEGVKPRSGLQKMYTYIRYHGKLPEYSF